MQRSRAPTPLFDGERWLNDHERRTQMRKSLVPLLVMLFVLLFGSLAVWAATYDWVQVPTYTPDPGDIGRKPLTGISFAGPTVGNAVGYYTDTASGGYKHTQAQH